MLAGGCTVTTGNGKTQVSETAGVHKTKIERSNNPEMILFHVLI
jgi:hypothetical protein